MTLTPSQALISILVMSAVTLFTRAAPFILFDRESPSKTVLYMGRALPLAIIAMLIIFCLRNIDFLSGSRGIPELISAILVVLLHLWKRNNLLSIFGGTIIYMIILQNFPFV